EVRRSLSADRGPHRGVLRAQEQRARATHRVAYQVDPLVVDVEFLANHRDDVHHVLFAQLREIRWWRRRCLTIRSRLALPAAAPSEQWRSVPAAGVVTQRRS